MEGEQRKRRKSNEQGIKDEEEKIELFYALIRSTHDLRDLLSNGWKDHHDKEKKNPEEKPVWTPTFELEDFKGMEQTSLKTLLSASAAKTASTKEVVRGESSGLNLELSL